MFTGIIETLGTVAGSSQGRLTIVLSRPFKGLGVGESVAVDGVCLTVNRIRGREATFQLLPETRRVSTLGKLRVGDPVHLERSLRLGDRLGGHFLLGHVDGQGKILSRSRKGSTQTLELRIPPSLAPYLVPKGPIAVDGVSLTLDPKIRKDRVRVHLISQTISATKLGKKPVGSPVNLEVDLIAKYLRGVL